MSEEKDITMVKVKRMTKAYLIEYYKQLLENTREEYEDILQIQKAEFEKEIQNNANMKIHYENGKKEIGELRAKLLESFVDKTPAEDKEKAEERLQIIQNYNNALTLGDAMHSSLQDMFEMMDDGFLIMKNIENKDWFTLTMGPMLKLVKATDIIKNWKAQRGEPANGN